MLVFFIKQLHRETITYLRQLPLLLNAFLLFLLFMVFFPLTLPPDLTLMRTVLPGLTWMAVLLVLLLSAERMLQQDFEQGILEQWLVSSQPLPLLILAKVMVHWFFNVLIFLSVCPIVAVLYALNLWETVILALSLVCATPAMVFLSAFVAVFGVGVHQKGALMALILLPLTLPLMIFGAGTLQLGMRGLPIFGYLAILLAISITALSLLPFAIAALMRISLVD